MWKDVNMCQWIWKILKDVNERIAMIINDFNECLMNAHEGQWPPESHRQNLYFNRIYRNIDILDYIY